MSDQYVGLPTDGAGKKADCSELTVNSQTVERQRVVIADDATAAGLVKVQNGNPAATDYGLTVRVAGPELSCYHAVAAATNNAANIKASAGRLYSISVFNKADYPIYVKFYEKATAPTPGTDTVKRTFGVQAGMSRDLVIPMGQPFATGIAIAIVKLISETDNTSLAAGDCVVDVCYL